MDKNVDEGGSWGLRGCGRLTLPPPSTIMGSIYQYRLWNKSLPYLTIFSCRYATRNKL